MKIRVKKFWSDCAPDTNAPSASTNAPAGNADAIVKPYPLKTCAVSGDKIGAMGKPITTNYLGQEMKFCCKDCVKDFKTDPEKWMKKFDEEVKKSKTTEKK